MSSPASRKMSSPSRYHSPRNKLKRHSILSTSELAEEFTKVFISTTAAFQKSLDHHLDEQERLHKEALSKSLAEHEAVRQSAEQARLRVEAELERDRRRREDEEVARLEEIKRQAEQEQRKREEAAQRKREEQAKLERERVEKAEQARLEKERKKQADDEAAKQEADEKRRIAEKKAAEAADRAAAEKTALLEAQQQQQEQEQKKPDMVIQPQGQMERLSAPEDVTVLACTGGTDRRTQERQKYLTLHKKLKEMRAWTLDEAAKVNLKTQLGDMRRTIQKSLSIVNAIDKSKNTKPTLDIRTVLEQAAQIPIMLSLKELGLGDGQYPAALLFLLNYFAKYTIHRYTDQCSRDPKAADAYGVLVAQIFANSAFHFNSNSLIDVLWAKYYKVCPVLFGLSGGTTLEDQVGLAAGFASITLRNFSKSKNKNPAPNHLYWTSLARVLNTPPEKRTAAHYIVLRNMIIHSIDRFIQFYGSAALAAMRVAFKQWPEGVKRDANTTALEATPAVLEKEYGLVL